MRFCPIAFIIPSMSQLSMPRRSCVVDPRKGHPTDLEALLVAGKPRSSPVWSSGLSTHGGDIALADRLVHVKWTSGKAPRNFR